MITIRPWYYYGFGLGSFVAVFLSIVINKSVLWAIIHFFCTWFYVVWALVVHLAKIQAYFDKLGG